MLSKTLRERVAACAPQKSMESVCVAAGGITVRCELASVDTLSCAPVQIAFVREDEPSLATDELAVWVERVSQKVTALAEPLAVVEIDGLAQTALLRSRTPKRAGRSVAYFEAQADQRRCLTLRRFRYDETDRTRTAVPFPLTFDQLETLVAELESC